MSGRQACLQAVLERMTPVVPELQGVRDLADFRAVVEVRGPERHAVEIESLLAHRPPVVDVRGGSERQPQVETWRSWLGDEAPECIAVLRSGTEDDPIVAMRLDDLGALGGRLHWIRAWPSAAEVLRELEALQPDVLVVPSLATCRALEAVRRLPLEATLSRLKLVLTEFDAGVAIRSRVCVRHAGWYGQGGRLAVASVRRPYDSAVLAVHSQIIELLPYSNPVEDARRVYASQPILPEHAEMDQRYELVVTSAAMLRMRTGDHVTVVGFDPPLPGEQQPRPRVRRLPPPPDDLRLYGCTVAGAWLTASVRQCLQREDPALVDAEIGLDPRARARRLRRLRLRYRSVPSPDYFVDTEAEALANVELESQRPRGLLLRIELHGHVQNRLLGQLATRLDRSLRRRSPAYDHLRAQKELRPPRVLMTSAGTAFAKEQERIAGLDGPVQLPIVRVVRDL